MKKLVSTEKDNEISLAIIMGMALIFLIPLAVYISDDGFLFGFLLTIMAIIFVFGLCMLASYYTRDKTFDKYEYTKKGC